MKPMVKCGIAWIVLSMIFNVVTIAVIIYLLVGMTSDLTVEKAFNKFEVVPDVIPKAPTALAKVVYPGDVEVDLGNELTPTQVKNPPNVTWWNCDCQYYTLVMTAANSTDPDAPSRAKPRSREWQHWIVGNIRGANVTGGEVIAAYVGAGPPPKTGLHRYVFLVYRQPGNLTFDEPRLNNTSAANRTNFSVLNFAAKYKLGDPIAGNFFQAKYDNYVPTLFKQLNVG